MNFKNTYSDQPSITSTQAVEVNNSGQYLSKLVQKENGQQDLILDLTDG